MVSDNFKHHNHRRVISLWVAVIMIISVICPVLTSCKRFMSDDQLIRKRIEDFTDAYNAGDMEEILECMDSKTRNTFKSVMGIGEAFLKVKPSDLFGLSVGLMSDGDMLTVTEPDIEFTGDNTATANVRADFHSKASFGDSSDEAYFLMVKEDGDWFIKDFKSKN